MVKGLAPQQILSRSAFVSIKPWVLTYIESAIEKWHICEEMGHAQIVSEEA